MLYYLIYVETRLHPGLSDKRFPRETQYKSKIGKSNTFLGLALKRGSYVPQLILVFSVSVDFCK